MRTAGPTSFIKEHNIKNINTFSTTFPWTKLDCCIYNWVFPTSLDNNVVFMKQSHTSTGEIAYLHRTITKNHLATILHCFFKCHTKFRPRENLKPAGNLSVLSNNLGHIILLYSIREQQCPRNYRDKRYNQETSTLARNQL